MSKLQAGWRLRAIRDFVDQRYGKAEGMNVPYPPADPVPDN